MSYLPICFTRGSETPSISVMNEIIQFGSHAITIIMLAVCAIRILLDDIATVMAVLWAILMVVIAI